MLCYYLNVHFKGQRAKERKKIKTNIFFLCLFVFCGKGTELCIVLSSTLLLKCSYVRFWVFAAVLF